MITSRIVLVAGCLVAAALVAASGGLASAPEDALAARARALASAEPSAAGRAGARKAIDSRALAGAILRMRSSEETGELHDTEEDSVRELPDEDGEGDEANAGETEDDYTEEKEIAFFDRYYTELDEIMSEEGPDVAFESKVERLLASLVFEHDLGRLESVRCSPSFCRIELWREREEQRLRVPEVLNAGLGGLLQPGTVHLPTEERRVVAYYPKPGVALPQPTVSFAEFMRSTHREHKEQQETRNNP